MKNSNIFQFLLPILIMAFFSTPAFTQKTEADFRREEAERRQEIKKAFDIFINASNAESTRLRAVEKVPTTYDEKQRDLLNRIVRSPNESDAIRAMALNKLKHHLSTDKELLDQIKRWVIDKNTPQMLRKESLNALELVNFSSLGMQGIPDDLLSIYRKLTEDELIEFRRIAFKFLSLRNDDFAQQLLIRGLNNPQNALLPAPESIYYLSYNIHGDYYPVINRVLLETNDNKTKIQALNVLGNYEPARPKILEILNNAQEDEAVRLAAMKTLNAFDKTKFAEYVMPLFQARNTPDDLLAYAISAEKHRRNNNRVRAQKYNNGKYQLDPFDRNVKELYEKSSSSIVKRVANDYLRTLDFE
ncbi:MAG: hypothetical protein DHS20C18_23590 [Saprospiraceae bacterium]|nr:MAG: hypothetical protein DHS20C18_23590 [Saprospiraceae bacterium]